MRRNQNKVLDILAQNAPSSYYVASWQGSSGNCQEHDMTQSLEGPNRQFSFVLHLYVDISKL